MDRLSDQSRLEGDGLDSFGRRQPRRHYVPDPCRGSHGGGGASDVGGGDIQRPPRFAAADTDDDDDDDDDYIFRERQGRPSFDDEVSIQSDDEVIVDMAQHGDALTGRGLVDVPVTWPGAHLARPHGTSSVSSGTGITI